MKKLLTILLVMSATASMAQPVVNKAMDFSPGNNIRMMNCNGIAAGPSGANKTWNFANLNPMPGDTTTITFSTAPAGNPYGATLISRSGDSLIQYYTKTATQVLQTAMVDSHGTSGEMTFTNNLLIMQRELTYNLAINDTFEHDYRSLGMTGSGNGTIKLNVDGHGTLTLPNGTFSNVLRVRIGRNQTDTFTGPNPMNFETKIISYLWFDNAHKAPLLRIDSTTVFGSTDVTAAYLLQENNPTWVNDLEKRVEISGSLSNNGLMIRGYLKPNVPYNISLYNISGQSIFEKPFTAFSNVQCFDVGVNLPEGIYLVNLTELTNNRQTVIKLFKQ